MSHADTPGPLLLCTLTESMNALPKVSYLRKSESATCPTNEYKEGTLGKKKEKHSYLALALHTDRLKTWGLLVLRLRAFLDDPASRHGGNFSLEDQPQGNL